MIHQFVELADIAGNQFRQLGYGSVFISPPLSVKTGFEQDRPVFGFNALLKAGADMKGGMPERRTFRAAKQRPWRRWPAWVCQVGLHKCTDLCLGVNKQAWCHFVISRLYG